LWLALDSILEKLEPSNTGSGEHGSRGASHQAPCTLNILESRTYVRGVREGLVRLVVLHTNNVPPMHAFPAPVARD